jgi:hypothetical protein
MRIASLIARYLLGLGFLLFGSNGFFHFIPQPPMPPGVAKDYVTVLMATHYMLPVSALEVVAAILLLANRYVPFALTLLGPILVNILIFHVTMQLDGLPLAFIFVILWFLVFASVRSAFSGIFQNQVPS